MPVWGSADRLHARCVLVFAFHANEVAHGTHIDDKGPPLDVPAAKVGLSLHNEPTLVLVLYPLVPFPIRSLFFFPSPLLPLSDVQRRNAPPHPRVPVPPAAQQGCLVSPLHRPRLWYAPHPYCFLPSCFVPPMPDHPSCSALRNVPRRVPHLNEDTSVRARAFISN